METETETDKGAATIRIPAHVEKRTIVGNFGKRKHSVYDVKCGVVEVTGDTRADAVAECQRAATAMLEGYGSPVIMWSLDGKEAWIAFCTPSGWGYAISSAASRYNGRMGAMIYPSGGAWSTREECLEHMRSHWYDLNARMIVEGIIGLCTDVRLWDCVKCRTVQQGHAPYKCMNPACGLLADTSKWGR